MNQAENRDVERTLGHLKAGRIGPDLASSALATLHRSARTKRTQAELLQVMRDNQLLQHLKVVNGCYVPA